MNNVSDIKDCYGCGMCATVCPKHIVDIRLDKAGFYTPHIAKDDLCIDCGLCVKMCSFSYENLSVSNPVVASYAAWSNVPEIRKQCSSGGIAFELGCCLLEQGYKVCAVRYNSELNRSEHYISNTLEEFIPSKGSKYIQSYTVDGFKSVNRKDRNLIIGTPCQIDSFRHYIKHYKVEDNFVLVDFFCHGVPSKWVWDKYLKDVENTTGKVLDASWRNKLTGWHDSYVVTIQGERSNYKSSYSKDDPFYCLFLSDNCLGKACYDQCKYKYDRSAADIRIGDLWGEKYRNIKEGVSGVIVFTERGNSALKKANCTLIEESFSVVAEGQMKSPAKRGLLYDKLQLQVANKQRNIQDLFRPVYRQKQQLKLIHRMKHPYQTLQNVIRKITNKRKKQ